MAKASSFPLTWKLPSVQHETYDWITNSFERNRFDSLDVVPIKSEEPWETIPMRAELFKPRLVLGLFPAFLQIDARFHHAIRTLGMPVCTIAEEQSKVAAALIQLLGIGGVVATQFAFESFRHEVERQAPRASLYYQVILVPDERPMHIQNQKNTFYELHLVPGVVGLFQCQDGDNEYVTFHPNERFTWEFKKRRAYVSDTKHERFFHAELPQPVFVQKASCVCGRKVSLTLG